MHSPFNEAMALAGVFASGKFESKSSIQISLTTNRRQLENNSLSLSKSRAAAALDAETQAWEQRLTADSGEWFTWLLEQPQETVLSLIVFATANCADALPRQMSSSVTL